VSQDALELLISLHGDSLANMANELEKLRILYNDEEEIDVARIRDSVDYQRESSIEQLQEALCDRHLYTSMQIFRKMTDSGISSTQITINLAQLFQEIFWQKMGRTQPARYVWGVSTILMKRLGSISKRFSLEEIQFILIELRKIDVLTKSTSLSINAMVEPLIIQICQDSNG